jgi:putative ABC transport system permease protein
MIAGAALFASRFVPDRIAFSVAGAALLLWAGSTGVQHLTIGGGHTGNIFVVFVEGILLVVGALLLYAFNSKVIVDALTRISSRWPRSVPVVRVGLSYPGRRAIRTTINLLIFALVLFTVVAVASFGASLQSNLGNVVKAESGGYTDFATSQVPIDNLPGWIQNNTTLRPLFSQVVPILTGGVAVGVPSFGRPYVDGVYAAPVGAAPSSDFYSTNTYNFTSTFQGMTAAQVWSVLQTNGSVAVLDGNYATSGVSFGSSAPHPTAAPGTWINLTNPDTGRTVSVRVVGILGQTFLTGAWVNPTTAAQLGFSRPTAYFLTVAPGADPTYAGQRVKVAFFAEGLLLLNFAQILKSSIQGTLAIVGLLEVFVALGLAVGIAAMGIVALRAVVERRGEIGMLRAQGFTQGMIFRAFLLEYSFVALLGIAIGTVLGILLDYNLSSVAGGFVTFTVPWTNLLFVILVAYALVVVAVAGPSIKAARLPPAEAVRYSE